MTSGDEIEGVLIKDEWFLKHHMYKLRDTPGFMSWWLVHYGPPEAYDHLEDTQHEYYVRMAFALMGWRAKRCEKCPS